MKSRYVCLTFAFLGLVSLGYSGAEKTFYFPHYADGGGWAFQVSVSNLAAKTAAGKISFYDSYGALQAIPFKTGTVSNLDLSLPSNATEVLTSTGTSGTLRTGYAVVTLDQEDVTGSLMFKNLLNGTEATVLPQYAGRKFALFVENSATLNCGVAVAFSQSPQPLTLTLYTSQGLLKDQRSWYLNQKQVAKYLTELFYLGDFQGILVLESAADFTCIGLRLGNNVLSTIPTFDARVGLNPTVTITSPTSGSTHATSNSRLDISGTVTDRVAVSSVSWSNDRGGSGNASGTNTWSVSGIVLLSGQNIITVTALDAAGNTNTDVLTVTYTPSKTTSPVVTITDPTTNPVYSTNQSPLYISGTVVTDLGVEMVWSNDRGGKGDIEGCGYPANCWYTYVNIALASGKNVITITAKDEAGNIGTATLTVTYTATLPPDTTNPYIVINYPPSSSAYDWSLGTTTYIAGIAYDNVGVMDITWSSNRGGSGTSKAWKSSGKNLWWLSGDIVLQPGINVITATAKDAAGNIGTATLTIMLITTEPTIKIDSPKTAYYATDISSVDITAISSSNVTQVTWSNDRGGGGNANRYGYDLWNANVKLAVGSNVITFTAVAGADKAIATITVTYVLPGTIPGGPGTPSIEFSFVPKYGTYDHLRGQALHINPQDYRVVVYIGFDGRWWWIKPYSNTLTPINVDGSWDCAVVTGGVDAVATDFVAYLVPKDANFQNALGDSDISGMDKIAVAKVKVTRTP